MNGIPGTSAEGADRAKSLMQNSSVTTAVTSGSAAGVGGNPSFADPKEVMDKEMAAALADCFQNAVGLKCQLDKTKSELSAATPRKQQQPNGPPTSSAKAFAERPRSGGE